MAGRRYLIYLLIALGVLVAIAQGVLGNVVTEQLPVSLKPYATQLFISITVISIIIAELLYRAQEATKTYERKLRDRDRLRFLSRLQVRYTRRLSESFRGLERLKLGIREEADAVPPLSNTVQPSHSDETPSAQRDLDVMQAYELAEKALLVIVEPGAGKTTLLLDIALNLLRTAREDGTAPMPVIFSMASWAIKRPPLDEWMSYELSMTYQVPLELAESWVRLEEVMPILDGIDEVDRAHRPACVETINVYHAAHGLVPIVVSSRTADYFSQKSKLELRAAVAVEPLQDEQLDEYLAGLGEQFVGLRGAIKSHPSLRDLLTNPLILNIAMLTYEHSQTSFIPPVRDRDAWQDQLFQSYINRRLKEPHSKTSRYSYEQVTAWLGWLAQQMTEHGVTELYLEQLQPDWLPQRSDRRRFRAYSLIIFFLVSTLANMGGTWYVLGLQRDVIFGILLALVATSLLAPSFAN